MKIIHCADVHLDSSFSGLSPDKAQQRRGELRQTFSDMIRFIEAQRADIALLPGDLLDTPIPTRETLSFLKGELDRISFCHVFIAPGNHDYYSPVWEAAQLGTHVTVFSSPTLQGISIDQLNTTVWGWGFTDESLEQDPLTGFSVPDRGRVNLLCAHCVLDETAAPYAPIKRRELEASGFDYAALGHVHNPGGMKKIGDTYYAYSGCLEGRGYDETGTKGAYLIVLDKNENGELDFRPKRIRFCKKHYEDASLDVSGAGSISDITDRIDGFLTENGYDGDTLLRLALTGSIDGDLIISLAFLQEQFRDRLFSLELTNETKELTPQRDLENDPTIRGAFYRQLKDALKTEDPDEEEIVKMALELGLRALDGEELSL